jgi:hypothetical protein
LTLKTSLYSLLNFLKRKEMELLQNYESSNENGDSDEEKQAASDYTATSKDYLAKVEADDDQIQPRIDLELI